MSGSASSRPGTQPESQTFAHLAWNSLESYLVVCLVLASLFFMAAAAFAQQVRVILGVIGLWVILLDLAPKAGLLRRIGWTLIVSTHSGHEAEADRLPVLLRIGGAVLVLSAIATSVVPQQPEQALPTLPEAALSPRAADPTGRPPVPARVKPPTAGRLIVPERQAGTHE